MRVAWAIAWLFCVGCSSSSSDDVTPALCTKARDHLADLRVNAYDHVTDPAGKPVDTSSYRATLKKALGQKFIDTCVASMSPKQVRCTLDSKTLSEALGCK